MGIQYIPLYIYCNIHDYLNSFEILHHKLGILIHLYNLYNLKNMVVSIQFHFSNVLHLEGIEYHLYIYFIMYHIQYMQDMMCMLYKYKNNLYTLILRDHKKFLLGINYDMFKYLDEILDKQVDNIDILSSSK